MFVIKNWAHDLFEVHRVPLVVGTVKMNTRVQLSKFLCIKSLRILLKSGVKRVISCLNIHYSITFSNKENLLLYLK